MNYFICVDDNGWHDTVMYTRTPPKWQKSQYVLRWTEISKCCSLQVSFWRIQVIISTWQYKSTQSVGHSVSKRWGVWVDGRRLQVGPGPVRADAVPPCPGAPWLFWAQLWHRRRAGPRTFSCSRFLALKMEIHAHSHAAWHGWGNSNSEGISHFVCRQHTSAFSVWHACLQRSMVRFPGVERPLQLSVK